MVVGSIPTGGSLTFSQLIVHGMCNVGLQLCSIIGSDSRLSECIIGSDSRLPECVASALEQCQLQSPSCISCLKTFVEGGRCFRSRQACEGLGPSPRLLGRTFPANVKLTPFQSRPSHGVLHPSSPGRSETMSLTDVAPDSLLDSGTYEDRRCRGCACLGRCSRPGRVRSWHYAGMVACKRQAASLSRRQA